MMDVGRFRGTEAQSELNDVFEGLRSAAAERFVLGRRSIHGPDHWAAVERNVLILSDGLPGADIVACRLFAIFHDCERANEGFDPKHGHRAADYVAGFHTAAISRWIDTNRFERLLEAYRHHNDGLISDDPIIGVCWDADRLELPRVGLVPEARYFSTPQGRRMAEEIAAPGRDKYWE